MSLVFTHEVVGDFDMFHIAMLVVLMQFVMEFWSCKCKHCRIFQDIGSFEQQVHNILRLFFE